MSSVTLMIVIIELIDQQLRTLIMKENQKFDTVHYDPKYRRFAI